MMIATIGALLLSASGAAAQAPQQADILAGYTKRCDAGDMQGCAGLAIAYELGYYGARKDLQRAAALNQRACDGGVGSACLQLAFSEMRAGAPRDSPRAAALFERGCNLGDAMGCENLALLLLGGRAVDKDPARAVSVWTKACDLGNGQVCRNAATEFETGEHVPKDLNQAAVLYDQACHASERHADSGFLACGAAARLLRLRTPVDWPHVVALYEVACRKGFDTYDACVDLGNLYRDGAGVTRSQETALTFYGFACDRGFVPGCAAKRGLTGEVRPGEIHENVSEAGYLVSRSYSLNASVTLRLRFFGDDYSRLDHIDVVDEATGRQVQRLAWPSLGDAADGRTLFGGGPAMSAKDLDFDGYNDLMVVSTAGATGNTWHAVWLYDTKQRLFVHNKDLSEVPNLTPDPARKALTTFMTGGHAGAICRASTIRWISGKPVTTQTIDEYWDEPRKAYVKETKELVAGKRLALTVRETHRVSANPRSVAVERFSNGRLRSTETLTASLPDIGCR